MRAISESFNQIGQKKGLWILMGGGWETLIKLFISSPLQCQGSTSTHLHCQQCTSSLPTVHRYYFKFQCTTATAITSTNLHYNDFLPVHIFTSKFSKECTSSTVHTSPFSLASTFTTVQYIAFPYYILVQ